MTPWLTHEWVMTQERVIATDEATHHSNTSGSLRSHKFPKSTTSQRNVLSEKIKKLFEWFAKFEFVCACATRLEGNFYHKMDAPILNIAKQAIPKPKSFVLGAFEICVVFGRHVRVLQPIFSGLARLWCRPFRVGDSGIQNRRLNPQSVGG